MIKPVREFSFIVRGDKSLTFYASKHDHLNQYTVSWLNESEDKIDCTYYTTKTVKELINDGSWKVIKEFRKD